MSNDRLITDEIRATLERDDRIPHPAGGGRLTATWHGDTARQRRHPSPASSDRQDRARRAAAFSPSRTSFGSTPAIAGRTTRSAVRRCRR